MHRSLALLLSLAALLLAANAGPAAADSSSSITHQDAHAKLDVGGSSACAVLTGGGVRCWGEGEEGKLGLGSLARPNLGDDEHPATVGSVLLGETATAVTVGERHACAVLTSGALRCWGSGDQGQLGHGGTGDVGDNEHPVNAAAVDFGGTDVHAVSAGAEHTCAILVTDALRCWGANDQGQLGVGDKTPRSAPAAVNLGAGRTARAVTAGGDHTCAILDTGAVKCWGDGAWGATGLGSEADVSSPAPVVLPAGRTAEAIDMNYAHACALLDDDTVRCWGLGGSGQLGYADDETIGDGELPGNQPAIQLGGAATSISVGAHTSCAHLTSGQLRCWGSGGFGELGNGAGSDIGDTEHPSAASVVTAPAGQAIAASAGGAEFRCFAFADGTIRCAGWSAYGQAGWPDVLNGGAILDTQKQAVAQVPAIRFTGGGSDLNLRVEDLGAGSVALDGTRDVKLIVRNAGPQAVSGAVVQATWGGGLTAWGANGQGFFDSNQGEWTLGALNPGEVRAMTVTLKGTGTGSHVVAASVESVTGPADVDSTSGNGMAGAEDDHGSTSLAVVSGADLSISTQVATTELAVGGKRTMTVTVTNAGPGAATGVVTALVGADSWSVGAGSPSQGSTGNGGDWNVGTLAAGQSATVTYPMTAKTAGSKAVGAKISAAGTPDKDTGDHQSTKTVPIVVGADISLTTNPDSSALLGQSGAGYVYAQNQGGATADVQVEVSIPDGLALDKVTPTGVATWDAASRTVTFPALAPGQNRTMQFVYHGVAAGSHVFGAEVRSSTRLDPDSTPGNGIAAGEDDDLTRTAAYQASAAPKPPAPAASTAKTATTPSPAAPRPQSTSRSRTTTRPQAWVNRPSVKVSKRVPTVTLSTNRAARVQLVVQRWTGKRWARVLRTRVAASTQRTRFRLERLAKGKYRLTASIPGYPGTRTVRFTVA